ncbi:YigZ family protein [Cytophagaceae bacterium ABcell3]|nr:YigZ family protein [Cytophagaceae bacterium ABcell3]
MTDEDRFLTIEGVSEGLYKEKGSKFISFAFPAHSEEDAKEIINEKRKEFYDARHVCFAWIFGKNGERIRANDDGEPNHSAGDPILNQIRSHNLTNVLVIVVRYFGGTKLGVSGLITAYKTAAAEALNKATIVEKYEMDTIQFSYSYENTSEVMRTVNELAGEITDQEFDAECRMKLAVAKSKKKEAVAKLEMVDSVTFVS